jgi:hypothetical protein
MFPVWLDKTAAETSKPAGGVQGLSATGELEQYKKSSEPVTDVVGGVSRKVCVVTAEGRPLVVTIDLLSKNSPDEELGFNSPIQMDKTTSAAAIHFFCLLNITTIF